MIVPLVLSIGVAKKYIKILEYVQGRARKMVKGLKGMTWEEHPKKLGLFSLEKREFAAFYNFLVRGSGE